MHSRETTHPGGMLRLSPTSCKTSLCCPMLSQSAQASGSATLLGQKGHGSPGLCSPQAGSADLLRSFGRCLRSFGRCQNSQPSPGFRYFLVQLCPSWTPCTGCHCGGDHSRAPDGRLRTVTQPCVTVTIPRNSAWSRPYSGSKPAFALRLDKH